MRVQQIFRQLEAVRFMHTMPRKSSVNGAEQIVTMHAAEGSHAGHNSTFQPCCVLPWHFTPLYCAVAYTHLLLPGV